MNLSHNIKNKPVSTLINVISDYPSFCFVVALAFLSSCSKGNSGDIKSLIELPTRTEEEIMNSAKDAYDSELYTRAREEWTALQDGYPGSYFAPLAQLKIADSYFEGNDFVEAIGAYQEFIRLHSSNEAVPYAHYRIALSYLNQYGGVQHDQAPLQEAMKAFRTTAESFPSSSFGQHSLKQVARCQSTLTKHDIHVADFYEKQGLLNAARHRRGLAEQTKTN